MKNKVEVKVTPEMLESNKVNDEFVFRELAGRMVREMPMAELRKLIKLTKIDPHSEHSKLLLLAYLTPESTKTQILGLKEENVVLYEAEYDSSRTFGNR